jgi:hypothetical protein
VAAYCHSPRVLYLELPDGSQLDLMDEDNGYRIESVDLGYPEVRENTVNRADTSGLLDYSSFYGGRVVSIVGSIVPSAAGSRSRALDALTPYLSPMYRSALYFQFDDDVPVKMVQGLRPSAFTAPVTHPTVSAFSIAWKASDPYIYDSIPKFLYAGRRYSLFFDREYPRNPITPPHERDYTEHLFGTNEGTAPTAPVFELGGPGRSFAIYGDHDGHNLFMVRFENLFFQANRGQTVVVDCAARSITMDGADVYGNTGVRQFGRWPLLPPGVEVEMYGLFGDLPTADSSFAVRWRDAFVA